MGHFSGNICCHSFGAFHHLLTSSVFTLTFKCIPSHDVVSSQRSAQTNDTKTCQGSTVTFFLSNFCTPNNEVLKSACKLQAACNFTCAHAHAHASACNQPCVPRCCDGHAAGHCATEVAPRPSPQRFVRGGKS